MAAGISVGFGSRKLVRGSEARHATDQSAAVRTAKPVTRTTFIGFYPAVNHQFQGIMRPARPMVESMPAAITPICACIPFTSVAKMGSASSLAFIP